MERSKTQAIVFGLLAIALVTGFVILSPNQQTCQEHYRRDATLRTGSAAIEVQVVKTPSEREMGLSGRQCLGPNQGMLFVFDKPGFYSFWMKDMKFPIDVAWLDADNRVVDVKRNWQPASYPSGYTNQAAAKKVLELPAGSLEAWGIRPGTRLN